MSEPARISYSIQPGHEPEGELRALGAIYELAIRKAAAKKKPSLNPTAEMPKEEDGEQGTTHRLP